MEVYDRQFETLENILSLYKSHIHEFELQSKQRRQLLDIRILYSMY